MKVGIPFWKMHGAGNDFILFDDRGGLFPCEDKNWLQRIADRRRGIGSEGIVLLQKPDGVDADLRMRFFNPDGGEADMCGNAARCFARLAFEIRAAPAAMKIATRAGIIRAQVEADGQVRLWMTEPRDWRLHGRVRTGDQDYEYGFVNSGVPHAVLVRKDVAAVDVQTLGRAVRYHEDFAPQGTNVNFIEVTGPQSLRIRTYERGVEGETLACGTGMVAAALVAGRLGLVKPPVALTCAGGDVLTVAYEPVPDGARDVQLVGPAVFVFRGVIGYGA